MREPVFWWRKAGLRAGLLSPLAAIYGAVVVIWQTVVMDSDNIA